MATPLLSLLADINGKIDALQEERDSLYQRIKTLEEEKSDLSSQLAQAQDDLHKAKLDVEFLTMSHRLADNPDTIIAARRRIARLIRTIDNCISMLKEE